LSLLWGLLLGLVQGATEFLPVSSSAHLAFLGALAGIGEKDALPFFLVLHLGTLAALAAYFRNDILSLTLSCIRLERPGLKTAAMILLTTVPTGIIGLALKNTVERTLVSPSWAAVFLVVTAAALFATKFSKEKGLTLGSIRPSQALLIGVAQGLSVVPGISRSGSTLAAGLFCGLRRDDAFRYSFLASIPAVAGAFVLDLKEISGMSAGFGSMIIPLSFFVAAASGLLSLVLLKRSVVRGGLHWFAIYCLFASACGFLVAFFVA